jgi:TolB-like protein/Tfp pilus assembly protein PilF
LSVFRELQRRKVIRVAGVYLVASWLLLQIAATVAPILSLPPWFEELVFALLALGFPIALIFAWAFELTPDGVKRDTGATEPGRGRILDYAILAVIALGAIWLLWPDIDKAPATDATLDPSVAVLPFANLNNDEENAPFAAGIHSDLLTQLARINSLRTVSRTSMLRYRDSDMSVPEIAAELDVATILEGGVQRAGLSVRINVTLIDAVADEPLWTEVYDRELTAANVFAIQSEIAKAISDQLRVTLSNDDLRRLDTVPTNSIDALKSYFVGKQMLDRRTVRSLTAAAEYFEAAVELDPDFALGWSGLADAYMLLPEYSSSVDRGMIERRAREGVLRALELDPELPEVRATEAWYQLRFFDWAGAERIFREALGVAPDNTNVLHWLSHTLSWQGQYEEAVAMARRALEVEPESNIMRSNLAYILIDAGLFEEGLRIAAITRKLRPEHTIQLRNLYLHELRAGRPADAAASFITYVTVTGGDGAAARQVGDMFVAYAEHGKVSDISQELIDLTQLGSEDLAQVLASVGDADGTIAALQVAAAEHSGSRSVFSMKINSAYDFIRDDPRFVALLEEVGLAGL